MYSRVKEILVEMVGGEDWGAVVYCGSSRRSVCQLGGFGLLCLNPLRWNGKGATSV